MTNLEQRQPFGSADFFEYHKNFRQQGLPQLKDNLLKPTNDSDDRRRLSYHIANDTYELLSLNYTAGEPIAPLRDQLEEVVAAYERYTVYLRAYEGEPTWAPISFDMYDEYLRCMQLIGLCYLLHRRDLLPRIAAMQDPNYRGHDIFYEDFLDCGMEGRSEPDTSYWAGEYDDIYQAMYAETEAEKITLIKDFVQDWYPQCKNISPWHDGHLDIRGTEGYYFGYWAFEAGAIAYLLDIDDSSIDHMVYPKALVQWARENQHLATEPAPLPIHARVEAGMPCPHDGYYFTPAKSDSRKLFKRGELMPEIGNEGWATIWQWDMNQE